MCRVLAALLPAVCKRTKPAVIAALISACVGPVCRLSNANQKYRGQWAAVFYLISL